MKRITLLMIFLVAVASVSAQNFSIEDFQKSKSYSILKDDLFMVGKSIDFSRSKVVIGEVD